MDQGHRPAIIITAFGSGHQAGAPYRFFQKAAEQAFPDYRIRWGYTSEILCRRLGLPGLRQTLAALEAAGHQRAVIQPLHIFPGTEYRQIEVTSRLFPKLRIVVGETLLHRRSHLKETLAVVEQEFLPPDKGLNLLALHGTQLVKDPANDLYRGLQRLVADWYPNVMAASVEGVPDASLVLAEIDRQGLAKRYQQVKIIPMMYVAGLHADRELMGKTKSWRTALEAMGFCVECAMTRYEGMDLYKGLGFYPEIVDILIQQLRRSLALTSR